MNRRLSDSLDRMESPAIVGGAIATAVTLVSWLVEPPPPVAHAALPVGVGLVSLRPLEAPVLQTPPPADMPSVSDEVLPLSPQRAAAISLAIPTSRLSNPAAAPFVMDATVPDDRPRAQTCLSMAIYYEAASESENGQAAVAQVVLNRLRHPMFPKTVCGVVFQGSQLPTGCQFTFTCDGSLSRRPSVAGWARAWRLAGRALDGYVETDVGLATHYHTIWVTPYWQSSVVKVAQIGAHAFFRWRSDVGADVPPAARYAGGEPLIADLHDALRGEEPSEVPATIPPAAIEVAERTTTPAIAAVAPAAVQPLQLRVETQALGDIEPPSYFGHARASQARIATPDA
jgi:spore germination cell wall hydrolase CwlJ-like protein